LTDTPHRVRHCLDYCNVTASKDLCRAIWWIDDCRWYLRLPHLVQQRWVTIVTQPRLIFTVPNVRRSSVSISYVIRIFTNAVKVKVSRRNSVNATKCAVDLSLVLRYKTYTHTHTHTHTSWSWLKRSTRHSQVECNRRTSRRRGRWHVFSPWQVVDHRLDSQSTCRLTNFTAQRALHRCLSYTLSMSLHSSYTRCEVTYRITGQLLASFGHIFSCYS